MISTGAGEGQCLVSQMFETVCMCLVCQSVWSEGFSSCHIFQCTAQLRTLQAAFDEFRRNTEVTDCNLPFGVFDAL